MSDKLTELMKELRKIFKHISETQLEGLARRRLGMQTKTKRRRKR